MLADMRTVPLASEIRDKVLHSRNRFWRPEDFEGSADAVVKTLSRLEAAGELRRVRRGLYWRGMSTPLGMAPPPADRLVRAVVHEPGTGPASWSAALALGLSTQVPRREVIAVPGRAPQDTRGVHFVSRSSGTGRRDERLRPAEVAVLEVLRGWEELVETPLPEAVVRIGCLIDAGTVRVDHLVRASRTEPSRVRQRLRRLLVALGREADASRVPAARSGSVGRDLALVA